MLRYIARRILIAIPTLIIVSILVFALQKLLPGDPVLTMAGEERDPQVLAYLREKYRLDDPIPIQYFAWIGSALHRQSRDLAAHRHSGARPHPRQASRHARTRHHGHDRRARHRHSRRHHLGREEGNGGRLRRQRRRALGPVHPQFLARHHAHHAGLGALAAAAGLRLCAADRGSVAQHQDHDHAGLRARHGPRREPDAPHPQRHARRAALRLHPHRPRQGPAVARRSS